MGKGAKIVVSKNGPYLVSGKLPLGKEIIEIGSDGEPARWQSAKSYPVKESYALCRCGQSKHKPFCDGTHAEIKFKGTETASRKKYSSQAKKIIGPGLVLADAPSLCASARFCHGKGGIRKLVLSSDKSKLKAAAVREACNCPSGRLVARDKKTGKPIEPHFEPSLSLIEDPQAGVSGPIWVKGGAPVESSDGHKYKTRNRVTLCRCGKSKNKPFCDGTHISSKFSDGDKSLGK